jgi:HTH-type transcriptional regulator/antitoxin HipB
MLIPIRTSGQLGPALKQLRKKKGWSQAELGRRVGLSQERISGIENAPEKVSFDMLLTMMMALGAEFMVSDTKGNKGVLSGALPAENPEPSGETW